MNRGIRQRIQSSLNRCIQNYFISTPLDFTLSPVQLADAFTALEYPLRSILEQAPRVSLQSTVTVENLLTGEITDFILVDPKQRKLEKGQLSCLSPLGRRLMGCGIGDKVRVNFLGSRLQVRILAIA